MTLQQPIRPPSIYSIEKSAILRACPLQVKCVPWLPSMPWAKRSLDLVPVRAAMAAPAVTLREHMRLEDVRQVLRDSRHNGFPVVRDSPAGQVRAFVCVCDPPCT